MILEFEFRTGCRGGRKVKLLPLPYPPGGGYATCSGRSAVGGEKQIGCI
jgi:hypothetical protein